MYYLYITYTNIYEFHAIYSVYVEARQRYPKPNLLVTLYSSILMDVAHKILA